MGDLEKHSGESTPALSGFEILDAGRAALRDRRKLIILCVVIPTILAILVNAASPKYQATAVLAFTPLTSNEELITLGVPAQPPPTGAQLLQDDVLRRVAQSDLTLFESPAELRNRLQVRQAAGSLQADLLATAPTAADAVRLVNTWATAVVESRNAAISAAFDKARGALDTARANLKGTGRDPALERTLRVQAARFVTARAALQGDTQVVATGTAGAVSHRKFSEIVAAVLGLFVGVGLALALAVFDRRVRTA